MMISYRNDGLWKVRMASLGTKRVLQNSGKEIVFAIEKSDLCTIPELW